MAKPQGFVSPRNFQNPQPVQNIVARQSDKSGSSANPCNHSRYLSVLALCTLMIVSTFSSGCCFGTRGGRTCWNHINEFMEQQVACMRDQVWARRAFHLRFGNCDRVHAPHFQDGFMCGYGNVCEGGLGETPALPPENYWGVSYRSQEGLEMQNAWFEGFAKGAAAAKHDGLMTFNEIQISKEVAQAMEYAEQMKMLSNGVEKTYIVDMAPVKSGDSVTIETSEPPSPQGPGVQPEEADVLQPMLAPRQREIDTDRSIPFHIIPADVPLNTGQQGQR